MYIYFFLPINYMVFREVYKSLVLPVVGGVLLSLSCDYKPVDSQISNNSQPPITRSEICMQLLGKEYTEYLETRAALHRYLQENQRLPQEARLIAIIDDAETMIEPSGPAEVNVAVANHIRVMTKSGKYHLSFMEDVKKLEESIEKLNKQCEKY